MRGGSLALCACLQPQEHEIEPGQAEFFPGELVHLGQHVGLLDALDDKPVIGADVVEEVRLE